RRERNRKPIPQRGDCTVNLRQSKSRRFYCCFLSSYYRLIRGVKMSLLNMFLNQLNVPEKCKVDKTLFNKLFEQANDCHKNILDVKDRECLKKDIAKITWLYSFKPSTINIPAYKNEVREYLEVAVLQVDVVNKKNIVRINDFFNRSIPYPLLILFYFEDEGMEHL